VLGIAENLRFTPFSLHGEPLGREMQKNEECGQRKGSHYLDYASGLIGLESSGCCHVAYERVSANYVRRKCLCRGFSDGKRWKDGKRT
jgi:hypothetical protein